MDFMYSCFFGGAVATVAYSKLGRRAGYGNTANVWTIVGVVFVLVTVVFYTIMDLLLDIH